MDEEEGLILVGGELGPIEVSIVIGSDNFVRAKLLKKAEKIRDYSHTLDLVASVAAKAYHAERLAFKVL